MDVLLITADAELVQRILRCKPVAAHLTVCASATASTVVADEVWLDLESCDAPASLPVPRALRRYVYFAAEGQAVPAGLPLGMVVRKGCRPSLIQVLWSASTAEPAPSRSADVDASDSLPAWVVQFQTPNLRRLCRRMERLLPQRLGFRQARVRWASRPAGGAPLAATARPQAAPAGGQTASDSGQAASRAPQAQPTLPLDSPSRWTERFTGRSPAEESSAIFRPVSRIALESSSTAAESAEMIVPLVSHGRFYGAIELTGRRTQDEHSVNPALLGRFLGSCVHSARTLRRARREARMDGLTGLCNDRRLREALHREVSRAARFGKPLAVAVLDVDELKDVNDRHGHAAGDALLRHAARLISAALRACDVAARCGGDEFAIVLPETGLSGATLVLERLMTSVRSAPLLLGGHCIPVRISAGVAQWDGECSAAELLARADAAMYASKTTRRGGARPARGSVAADRAAAAAGFEPGNA